LIHNNANTANDHITRAQWLLIIIIVIYETSIYFTNDAYLPALPTIAQDLQSPAYLTKLTITVWFLGSASTQLLTGPLSEYFGRRPVLLTGGIVFIISTLLCALAVNMPMLLVMRFFQGMTIPTLVVPGYAFIHETFNREKAIHLLAVMSSITVVAPSIGPLIGSLIVHFSNWRWLFVALVIAPVFAVAFLYRQMPETAGAAHGEPFRLTQFLGQYGRLLSNSLYMKHAISLCCLFAAVIAWVSAGPFIVMKAFGYSIIDYGLLQALVFASFIIGNQTIKPLMRHVVITKLIHISLIIACSGGVGALIFSWVMPYTLSPFVTSMVVISLGSGLCMPVLERLVVEASNESQGINMSLLSTLITTFGVLGSGLISLIYNGQLMSLGILLTAFATMSLILELFPLRGTIN